MHLIEGEKEREWRSRSEGVGGGGRKIPSTRTFPVHPLILPSHFASISLALPLCLLLPSLLSLPFSLSPSSSLPFALSSPPLPSPSLYTQQAGARFIQSTISTRHEYRAELRHTPPPPPRPTATRTHAHTHSRTETLAKMSLQPLKVMMSLLSENAAHTQTNPDVHKNTRTHARARAHPQWRRLPLTSASDDEKTELLCIAPCCPCRRCIQQTLSVLLVISSAGRRLSAVLPGAAGPPTFS